MLKANKFYVFHYPDNEKGCYQVLEEFPNNFVKVWWLRGGYSPSTKKTDFNTILCDKMFINLEIVSSINEIDIPD